MSKRKFQAKLEDLEELTKDFIKCPLCDPSDCWSFASEDALESHIKRDHQKNVLN